MTNTNHIFSLTLAISAALSFASGSNAQTITESPDKKIAAMTADQVDYVMSETAAATVKSAPIHADAVTTITSAVYIRPQKTLFYRVLLSSSIRAADAAASMKPSFCSSRTNRAFMNKGVTYKYGVTTPTESYDIAFTARDC